MIVSDMHSHSTFSHDGRMEMEVAVQGAIKKGLQFFGISEHFDYDYFVNRVRYQGGVPPTTTDPKKSFPFSRKLQEKYKGKIELLIGCELGFVEDEPTYQRYQELIKIYRPDYVINSLHSHYASEFSDENFLDENGRLKPKDEVVKEYLGLIKKSVSVPYDYDIVGHIGYLSRYLKQEDKTMPYQDYKDEYDAILKEIVARDKILEVNTATKTLPFGFLPREDVLKAYYSFGGRKISFGSDAHDEVRIGEKRDLVEKALKEIGFEGITVPKNGEHILIKFE